MCCVYPRSGKEKATVIYPFEEDADIPLKQIDIVVVFNGIHHYTATAPSKTLMTEGIDELTSLLARAANLCSDLECSAKDQEVERLFNQNRTKLKTFMYKCYDLFKPVIGEVVDEDQPDPKKMKLAEDTRKKQTVLTKLHCGCGKLFSSDSRLISHKQLDHLIPKVWDCTECEQVCKEEKSLKRHYRTTHLGEKLHWCQFCETGSNERHVIMNHMSEIHLGVKMFKCSKAEDCGKSFGSLVHLKKHEDFCGEGKKFTCPQCFKKYKRQENLGHHMKSHTKPPKEEEEEEGDNEQDTAMVTLE